MSGHSCNSDSHACSSTFQSFCPVFQLATASMEGSHGGFTGGGGGGKAVFGNEDFQEEEVWAMMKPKESSHSKVNMKFVYSPTSSPSSAWRLNATPRSIPRAAADGGGNEEPSAAKWVARGHSSAPIDVPDWSKILKRGSKKNLWDDACDAYDHDDDGARRFRYGKVEVENGDYDDDDDGHDDDGMVPPHEYLARRLASTQIASFSMCEGVGRTLKGRDLSKLRNAILTKTGFIE